MRGDIQYLFFSDWLILFTIKSLSSRGAVKLTGAETSIPNPIFAQKLKFIHNKYCQLFSLTCQAYLLHFGKNVCQFPCLNNHSLSVILPNKTFYAKSAEFSIQIIQLFNGFLSRQPF